MGRQRGRGCLPSGVRLSAVGWLLLAAFVISTAYGMVLLLPLYVQKLGGNEASFGVILSAATVPAVLCIGLLMRYPHAVRPHAVVASAAALYALGASGAALVSGGWVPLVGIGVLLGTAWAVVYTAFPMVLSEVVTDAGRATYFGYLTGTQQIGIGTGPVIARTLVETKLGFRGTFLVAAVLCLAAVALAAGVGRRMPDARFRRSHNRFADRAVGTQRQASVSFATAIARIGRSEAVFPLIMILLFACLFTSLTQFQTTFAAAKGLNYAFFYFTYTIAVIVSRFGLARVASRFDPGVVIAISVSVMALAVAAFLLVGSNTLLYTTASAVVGLGYGLALPTVQAQAVNVSDQAVRPRVLPLAGLLFQAAILGFPVIAGWIAAGLGYATLFAVLVTVALVQAAIGWSRYTAATRAPVAATAHRP